MVKSSLELKKLEYNQHYVDYIYYHDEITIIDVCDILNGNVSSFKKAYFLSIIKEDNLTNDKSIKSLIDHINNMSISFIDL